MDTDTLIFSVASFAVILFALNVYDGILQYQQRNRKCNGMRHIYYNDALDKLRSVQHRYYRHHVESCQFNTYPECILELYNIYPWGNMTFTSSLFRFAAAEVRGETSLMVNSNPLIHALLRYPNYDLSDKSIDYFRCISQHPEYVQSLLMYFKSIVKYFHPTNQWKFNEPTGTLQLNSEEYTWGYFDILTDNAIIKLCYKDVDYIDFDAEMYLLSLSEQAIDKKLYVVNLLKNDVIEYTECMINEL